MDDVNKMIKLADCEIGQEYVTKQGKRIQLTGKSTNRAKILVLATDTEITVPIFFPVFKLDYVQGLVSDESPKSPPDESDVLNDTSDSELVRASDVISEEVSKEKKPELKTKKPVESKSAKSKSKKNQLKTVKTTKKGSRMIKKLTAKQHVWNLLKKSKNGITKTKLAEEIVAKGLSDNVDVKKVKNYVGLIIAGLKKKEHLKIRSIEPGKYVIDE